MSLIRTGSVVKRDFTRICEVREDAKVPRCVAAWRMGARRLQSAQSGAAGNQSLHRFSWTSTLIRFLSNERVARRRPEWCNVWEIRMVYMSLLLARCLTPMFFPPYPIHKTSSWPDLIRPPRGHALGGSLAAHLHPHALTVHTRSYALAYGTSPG